MVMRRPNQRVTRVGEFTFEVVGVRRRTFERPGVRTVFARRTMCHPERPIFESAAGGDVRSGCTHSAVRPRSRRARRQMNGNIREKQLRDCA